MIEEMESIKGNQTWCLVPLPPGQRPIGLKWVFKVKKNSSGEVVKHKARLVAKGYVQQQGIDYEEAFAPVARIESVRLLLALAAQEGWAVHHMDVKSAFLNGELREEVYVKQPPGFIVEGEEQKVLKLDKALYGLRQAPRAWNDKLHTTLVGLGFQHSASEHAVYAREIEAFKRQMQSKFKMSDLGLLCFYLGIEVNQTEDGITLSQAAYARKILERAGMEACNPSHTPMEPRLKLSKTSTAAPVDATGFMEAPTTEHLSAVKRILRYVAGTIEYGCSYKKTASKLELYGYLHGYSDSDMAGDIDTCKSTSGSAIALSKNPVFHERSKHIDTRFYYIRECIGDGKMKVKHVRTEEQLADILTKPFGRD
ncbi:hypothetical protein U9M48_001522, partial [Paspalum notatum var. saurae]